MADSYSKWVMTTAFANNLQASINSGNKIEWVSIKTSNDTHLFADLAGFNDTTLATASIKQTATINTISINGNTVTITALFNNQNNQADYYIKTLFLVAKYNGTEFLAGATVANSASTAFRMPAASATEITEFTARPQITVSNSSTISATVDPVAAATNKRVDGLETTLQGEIDDINADKQSLWNTLVNYVTKAGTDTITGVKTFTQTIVGSITGNAGTATKLQTPRKLKVNLASTADQTFDGSADQVGIGVTGVLPVKNGGSGRADGQSQSVNSLGVTIQGFEVGNTITSNQLLAGITGKFYGTYVGNIGVTLTSTFHVVFTVNGNSNALATIAVDEASGSVYTAVIAGIYSGSTFTITTAPAWVKMAIDSTVVHNAGNETIAGIKTFSSPISGSITGNAGTANVLNTRVVTFTDFSTVASDMIKYSGFWDTAGTAIANGPLSLTYSYANIIVIPGIVKTAGIIMLAVYVNGNKDLYYTNVSGSNISGWVKVANDSTVVHNTGNETIAGTKTFSSPIVGSITGNAGTSTKLATARTINGVAFDGTANISVNAANDASLVHRTGDETIGGVKTFTGTLVANNPIQGNIIRYNILDGYDLNGYKDTGDFVINGANNLVNYPDNASNYAVLHVEKLNNDTSIQTLTTTENIIYTRIYGGSPSSFGNWKIMATGTSTTINLYGKGTYFTTDSYLVMIVSGKVVSVQGTLTTKVDMSGGVYLTENLIPAQYAPSVARKNMVGFNSGTAGTKVYADVAWSINGDISIDNIVNGSNMTAWGTIPARSQLSFADTWVLA